nr:acyl-CoA dehydratase activase [uncultured Pseudodesulfovibrio sp.]
MHSLGIDIGYASIKAAVLDSKGTIIHTEYILHKGHVTQKTRQLLKRLIQLPEVPHITYGAVTGSGSAIFTGSGVMLEVNEVATLVEGALRLDNTCTSIIEMGGQTAKFITGFTAEDKTDVKVSMTSNCSSGTGSFLEEQVSRLGLSIEEYSAFAAQATFIPRIAGRCSVFAKTDIIHHQQEGVAASDILAGLAHAVVKNYRNAVMRGLPRTPPLLFVGGVSLNSAINDAICSVLGLTAKTLRVHEHSNVAGAIGAAILAAKEKLPVDLLSISASMHQTEPFNIYMQDTVNLEPLSGFGTNDSFGKHQCHQLTGGGQTPCWLGIDVGSTSTNLVLTDATNTIVAFRYLRTAGDPIHAVCTGLAELKKELGNKIRVEGVATTGSGRYMTGRLVGADVVRDEITAQARAATALDPNVDTIFEIGGQDSKFISLKNGAVTDFQMNKICAAGTGSFIEEQAKKLGIPLHEIGPSALAAESPISLGERCTVFMESSIAAHLAHGANTEDLSAGLCYSIIKNYMNRVVSQKTVGEKIFLQGGVAHNQGVVNAFRAVTGKEIIVPPFFSVTGAYGAAILAREALATEEKTETKFKGFSPSSKVEEISVPSQSQTKALEFNRRVQEFIFEGYETTMNPTKKTVGIPRALFTYGMFPLFYPFFRALDCNVLLSEPTSEETIRQAQEYSLDETCYPVKLINGHAAELVEKGVDFLFFPNLHTVSHPGSKARQNYGCAYMQLAFEVINKAMDLKNKGIKLLSPTIAFNQGKEFMNKVFMDLGWEVGANQEQVQHALQTAMQSFKAFEAKVEAQGKALADIPQDQKTFVLISKIYGVADPVLNLGIADTLAQMGYQTLPFYDLPEVDIFHQHPNMYWPFGQHILAAAGLIAKQDNLHAIFLTHHGCGPDTVLAHYFKEIMGNKPYLTIEVDEHSSSVGVITRVEAFVNSLDKGNNRHASLPKEHLKKLDKTVDINSELSLPTGKILLPNLYPYSNLMCEIMRKGGYDATLIKETCAASIDLGRQHTTTNEYFSMSTLLGDLLHTLNAPDSTTPDQLSVMLPQNEGAEVDGQYARFIRTKLDENGFNKVDILAPFMENLLDMGKPQAQALFLCLLAGDLVRLAPREHRDYLIETLQTMAHDDELNQQSLVSIAHHVQIWIEKLKYQKRIFALGEPLVLFNDTLNNNTFKRLEDDGHHVVFAPFSEYIWGFMRDTLKHSPYPRAQHRRSLLREFQRLIRVISEALGKQSHFESDLEALMIRANHNLGYYAGAFGRYRSVKTMGNLPQVDGVISVASMYENTGISLDILQGHANGKKKTPTLNLTFDGNKNENDLIKTDSFIYYL